MTDAPILMQIYQVHRDSANEIARLLEEQGYKGYYIRGGTEEKKPLDPATRPTQFVFEKEQ